MSTDVMGPYYDHLWQGRQHRALAADHVSVGSSRGVRDRALALVTLARRWFAIAGISARPRRLLWRTDERRAGTSRHTLVAQSIAFDPYAREDGKCR